MYNSVMTEFPSDLNVPDDIEVTATDRMRVLRAGLRNRDPATVDVFKQQMIKLYGDLLGERVFERLLEQAADDVNIEELETKYPDLKGKL